ncbi:interleukin-15 receptor subunit alpha isoform X1 [Equus caballus]|uniref:interleukin-15 receptor subunit alpha isoform X1 n=1 Tax=Equus caballus TaxID=9796 RepID=UPI0038B26F30
MARRRLRGCRVSALPALLLLLLLRPPVTPGITCPTPTSVEHADIRVKSYNLSSKERYICNSGFKRKAGTSSLTECVLNETTNLAHWTTPNLKCIRDPSLTRQRPPSTVVPAGVTPEPQSPSPSGKEPASTSKSDTTVATKPAITPGSRLMPSKSPSAATTGVVSHEPSQAPSQTTALEHTPSVASRETPGVHQYSSRVVTGGPVFPWFESWAWSWHCSPNHAEAASHMPQLEGPTTKNIQLCAGGLWEEKIKSLKKKKKGSRESIFMEKLWHLMMRTLKQKYVYQLRGGR